MFLKLVISLSSTQIYSKDVLKESKTFIQNATSLRNVSSDVSLLEIRCIAIGK